MDDDDDDVFFALIAFSCTVEQQITRSATSSAEKASQKRKAEDDVDINDATANAIRARTGVLIEKLNFYRFKNNEARQRKKMRQILRRQWELVQRNILLLFQDFLEDGLGNDKKTDIHNDIVALSKKKVDLAKSMIYQNTPCYKILVKLVTARKYC